MIIEVCCSKTRTIDSNAEFYYFERPEDYADWFLYFHDKYLIMVVTFRNTFHFKKI